MLYRRSRVGKDGLDFELLKLRTMIVGAEQQGAGFAVDRGEIRAIIDGRPSAPPALIDDCRSSGTWSAARFVMARGRRSVTRSSSTTSASVTGST